MTHKKSISSNFGLEDALSSTPEERDLVKRLSAGVERMEA